jgi:hypothetical protein
MKVFAKILLLSQLLLLVKCVSSSDSSFDTYLRNIKTYTTEESQAKAAGEVIVRLIATRSESFNVIIDFSRLKNSFKVIMQKIDYNQYYVSSDVLLINVSICSIFRFKN